MGAGGRGGQGAWPSAPGAGLMCTAPSSGSLPRYSVCHQRGPSNREGACFQLLLRFLGQCLIVIKSIKEGPVRSQ